MCPMNNSKNERKTRACISTGLMRAKLKNRNHATREAMNRSRHRVHRESPWTLCDVWYRASKVPPLIFKGFLVANICRDTQATPYDVTIIGDYNIGGDASSSRILLEEMGLRVIAQWSGDGSIAEIENTPKAKLNLIHCYRSMNYISRHMEEKYGIPWVEYNFFGPTKIEESLRKIASHFDDKIKEGAERVIAKYRPLMDAPREIPARLAG